jgi:hypothetical protein
MVYSPVIRDEEYGELADALLTTEPVRHQPTHAPSIERCSDNDEVDTNQTKNLSNTNEQHQSSTPMGQKLFRNCGYDTWIQTRHAWRYPENIICSDEIERSSGVTTLEESQRQQNYERYSSPRRHLASSHVRHVSSSSSPPHQPVHVPDNVKRDLIKCIKEHRHFQLSRSIPLKDVIDVYCQVWADGEDL